MHFQKTFLTCSGHLPDMFQQTCFLSKKSSSKGDRIMFFFWRRKIIFSSIFMKFNAAKGFLCCRLNGRHLLRFLCGIFRDQIQQVILFDAISIKTRVGEAAVAAATGKSGARTFGGKRLVANNFMWSEGRQQRYKNSELDIYTILSINRVLITKLIQ